MCRSKWWRHEDSSFTACGVVRAMGGVMGSVTRAAPVSVEDADASKGSGEEADDC
jgi:hypothetical protein